MIELTIPLTTFIASLLKMVFGAKYPKTAEKYGPEVKIRISTFPANICSHDAKTSRERLDSSLVSIFDSAGVNLPKGDLKVIFGVISEI